MIELNKNKYASQFYFAGKYVDDDNKRYEFTLEVLYNEQHGEDYEVVWLDHIPTDRDNIEVQIIQKYKDSIN